MILLVFMFLISLGRVDSQELGTNLYELTQLGSSIDGQSDDGMSGYAVALSKDGYRLAIGAYNEPGGGTERGVVRVYEYATSWSQIGSDLNGEGNGNDFGFAVSLDSDGSHLAVGARFNSGGGTNAGHARVFSYSTGTDSWNQIGPDIDGSNDERCGWSVSLSGNGSRIAIGSPFHNTRRGQNRVFDYNSGTDTWDQLGSSITGPSTYDYLGLSVSLSEDGTRVAMGVPRVSSQKGRVEIYDYDGTSSWTQAGSDIVGSSNNNVCGWSVSLSNDGNRVAIGCPGNTGTFNNFGGTSSGKVVLYDYITSSWDQVGSTITGESSSDHSGKSVSLSGDGSRVAIGSTHNDDGGTNAGQVRIYEFDGTSTWLQVGGSGDDLDGEASNNYFGNSVSLDRDGDRLAVGAYGHSGGGTNRGRTVVFQSRYFPTAEPSGEPSNQPSSNPSFQPTVGPTTQPTSLPSGQPSQPSGEPSAQPSQPSGEPSSQPSQPSSQPSGQPSDQPSCKPTGEPSSRPSRQPTSEPSGQPTEEPSGNPSCQPSRRTQQATQW